MKYAVAMFLLGILRSLWPAVDDEIIKRRRVAMMCFIFAALALIASFFLNGCAAVPYVKQVIQGSANEQISNGPLYQFRAELRFEITGKTFDGVTAALLKGPLDIKVDAKFPLNRLQITSCGRHEVFRNINKSWWGNISKDMSYHYVPSKYELEGPCPLYVEAFNKEALVAWGMIVFRNVENLPGHLICNGSETVFAGHSICQTKYSLEQAIYFDVPIEKFRADPSCNMKRESENTFKFFPAMSVNDETVCNAEFRAQGKWHTLTAFGYQRVLVQNE